MRYNNTRAYRRFKELMGVIRLILWIAFWAISYKYIDNLELNNQKDINRRDICKSFIELVCWGLLTYLAGIVAYLLFRGTLLRH